MNRQGRERSNAGFPTETECVFPVGSKWSPALRHRWGLTAALKRYNILCAWAWPGCYSYDYKGLWRGGGYSTFKQLKKKENPPIHSFHQRFAQFYILVNDLMHVIHMKHNCRVFHNSTGFRDEVGGVSFSLYPWGRIIVHGS